MSSLYVGLAAVVVGAAGTGVSLYGSSQASSAAKAAAANNARLAKAQTNASAAVSRYQAQLNYQTALAQAGVYSQNAGVLRDTARSTEKQGFEGIKRMSQAQDAQQSTVRASYGASGVQSDTGTPLVVQAYNAGMNQLARMDSAWETNRKAAAYDWDAAMQDYQATLTKETAKQYQYAESMANWSQKTGIQAAGMQQSAANNVANAQFTAAIGSAVQNFSSLASNFSNTMYQTRNPSPAVGSGTTAPTITSGPIFAPRA